MAAFAGLGKRGATGVRRRLLLAACAAATASTGLSTSRAAPAGQSSGWKDARVLETRQTAHGPLAVLEVDRVRYLAYGPNRELVYQSALDLDAPDRLIAPYTRLMMLAVVYASPRAHMVQIGVGAGSMARYAIRSFPEAIVDAVDIDAQAMELGRRYFHLVPGTRLRLHVADGRDWLAASDARYDAIMLDAYDDRSIPEALSTAGFYRLVASRLSDGGVAMQNVYQSQADARAVMAAMTTAFDQVDAYAVRRSLVLVGYQGPARPATELRDKARHIDAALRPLHALEQLLTFRVRAP